MTTASHQSEEKASDLWRKLGWIFTWWQTYLIAACVVVVVFVLARNQERGFSNQQEGFRRLDRILGRLDRIELILKEKK